MGFYEDVPKVGYTSKTELEARVRFADSAEREAFELTLLKVTEADPIEAHLTDLRFSVTGLAGSARIREVHLLGASKPIFIWTFKQNAELTAEYSKVCLEHEGSADTFDEARAALEYALHDFMDGEPELVQKSQHQRVHTRASYAVAEGLVINVDTFIERDGVILDPPDETAEFEVLLPKQTTPEAVAEAEAKIIALASALGIPTSRLKKK